MKNIIGKSPKYTLYFGVVQILVGLFVLLQIRTQSALIITAFPKVMVAQAICGVVYALFFILGGIALIKKKQWGGWLVGIITAEYLYSAVVQFITNFSILQQVYLANVLVILFFVSNITLLFYSKMFPFLFTKSPKLKQLGSIVVCGVLLGYLFPYLISFFEILLSR